MKKPNFSQAHGLEPMPSLLGLGELPKSARNQIWTVFHFSLEVCKKNVDACFGREIVLSGFWKLILLEFHVNRLDNAVDEFNSKYSHNHQFVKDVILLWAWNAVFDFIHEVINDEDCPEELIVDLASVFDKQQIAYRILVDEKMIVQRISDEEEAAFDEALKLTAQDRFSGAKVHLKSAATHLRDNRSADSIRESIHAVESVMKVLTGEMSGDFSKALNKLAPTISLHPALRKGFDAIYGYTSAEKGIRHCLLDESTNTTTDEAIFMLSSCASMINYLINKHDSIEGLKTLNQTT